MVLVLSEMPQIGPGIFRAKKWVINCFSGAFSAHVQISAFDFDNITNQQNKDHISMSFSANVAKRLNYNRMVKMVCHILMDYPALNQCLAPQIEFETCYSSFSQDATLISVICRIAR